MSNWVFIWENSRPKKWENVNTNLNMVIDFEHFIDTHSGVSAKNMIQSVMKTDHLDYSVPANHESIPDQFKKIPVASKLDGHILDQFENESFKYVVQKHEQSQYNENDELVLKEHLYPNVALNETNCKTLNLSRIENMLETHSWVALGTFFEQLQKNFDKLNILADSVFYARDKDTNKILNLSRKKQPNPKLKHLPCVTYAVFKKLVDTDIIICVLNPNLVSYTHFNNMSTPKHTLSTISDINKVRDYFFKPKIISGVKIGENNIFSNNGVVEIEMCGDCGYKYMHNNKPNFPYRINTNMEYTIKDDIITIDVSKNGYISIEYEFDSMLEYNFDRRKSKKTKIEYLLFGE